MPSKRVWPPKIYFHPNSGQARVRIDGHDVYLGPFGSEEAQKNYARVLHDYESTGSRPPPERGASHATVGMVAAAWLVEAERERGADSQELVSFRRTITVMLSVCGNLDAADFDPPMLEKVRNAMASGSWRPADEQAKLLRKNRPLGWCRNVVNRSIVRVGTIWRWAERRKMVQPGSYASLKTLPGLTITSRIARQTKRTVPATVEQLRAVRRLTHPVIRYMLTVQWWTGMRSAEVRTMRVGEIDCSDPTLWVYRPGTHKTAWRGQTRTVPLGKISRAIIGKLMEGKQPDDYVFNSSRLCGSRCYSGNTYAKAVRRAADAAGLPGWHPYLLRHGAKQRLTREFGLDVARAVLGQKSLGTTNGYGDAIDLQAASEAMRHRG